MAGKSQDHLRVEDRGTPSPLTAFLSERLAIWASLRWSFGALYADRHSLISLLVPTSLVGRKSHSRWAYPFPVWLRPLRCQVTYRFLLFIQHQASPFPPQHPTSRSQILPMLQLSPSVPLSRRNLLPTLRLSLIQLLSWINLRGLLSWRTIPTGLAKNFPRKR